MAVIQVSLVGHILAQPDNEIVNVFGYTTDAPVASLTEMATFVNEFSSVVIDVLKTSIANVMRWTQLRYRDVTPGFAAYDWVFDPAIAASVVSGPLPLFTSFGYQYVRSVVGQRSGAKRFGPVPEAASVNGVLAPSYADIVANVAEALATPLEPVDVGVHTPCILHKVGAGTYSAHDMSGVIFKRLTTQNSRKR